MLIRSWGREVYGSISLFVEKDLDFYKLWFIGLSLILILKLYNMLWDMKGFKFLFRLYIIINVLKIKKLVYREVKLLVKSYIVSEFRG